MTDSDNALKSLRNQEHEIDFGVDAGETVIEKFEKEEDYDAEIMISGVDHDNLVKSMLMASESVEEKESKLSSIREDEKAEEDPTGRSDSGHDEDEANLWTFVGGGGGWITVGGSGSTLGFVSRRRRVRRRFLALGASLVIAAIIVAIIRPLSPSSSPGPIPDTQTNSKSLSDSDEGSESDKTGAGDSQNQQGSGGIPHPSKGNSDFQPIFINAGAKQSFVSSTNQIWIADAPFVHSGHSTHNCPTASSFNKDTIDGVDEASAESDRYQIFCTERWFGFEEGDEEVTATLGDTVAGQYEIPVPVGSYRVIFHFAESQERFLSPGARVFDLQVEGSLVRRNFDIAQEAEWQRQSRLTNNSVVGVSAEIQAVAIVTDGFLTIAFRPVVQNPKVNAIEIHALEESPVRYFIGKADSNTKKISRNAPIP